MTATEAVARLLQFDTATLYESAGCGDLGPGLLQLTVSDRIAGHAVTVACPPGDNLAIHHAVAAAPTGSVLVVQSGDQRFGVWGEGLTAAAIARGIRGLILDGSVRDLDCIRAPGFPVYARGTALHGTTKAQAGAVGTPVTCAGQVVNPGDLIVADVSGFVAIAPQQAEDVIRRAEERVAKERAIVAGIGRGHTTVELLGLPARSETSR